MFKRVYLGPVANDDVRNLSDINAREFFMLSLLAIAVLYMGIFPHPFTRSHGHLGGRFPQARCPVQTELKALR
jgi:NADH:ubiquinone oxidoreductase subunit 4 (subunit M)